MFNLTLRLGIIRLIWAQNWKCLMKCFLFYHKLSFKIIELVMIFGFDFQLFNEQNFWLLFDESSLVGCWVLWLYFHAFKIRFESCLFKRTKFFPCHSDDKEINIYQLFDGNWSCDDGKIDKINDQNNLKFLLISVQNIFKFSNKKLFWKCQ